MKVYVLFRRRLLQQHSCVEPGNPRLGVCRDTRREPGVLSVAGTDSGGVEL